MGIQSAVDNGHPIWWFLMKQIPIFACEFSMLHGKYGICMDILWLLQKIPWILKKKKMWNLLLQMKGSEVRWANPRKQQN